MQSPGGHARHLPRLALRLDVLGLVVAEAAALVGRLRERAVADQRARLLLAVLLGKLPWVEALAVLRLGLHGLDLVLY